MVYYYLSSVDIKISFYNYHLYHVMLIFYPHVGSIHVS
jgi:hypothetical protein